MTDFTTVTPFPESTALPRPPQEEPKEDSRLRRMKAVNKSLVELEQEEPKALPPPKTEPISAKVNAELLVEDEPVTPSMELVISENPEEISTAAKHASDLALMDTFTQFMEEKAQSTSLLGLQLSKGVPGVENQRFNRDWQKKKVQLREAVKRGGFNKSTKESLIHLYTKSFDIDFLEIASSMLEHGIRNKRVNNKEELAAFIVENRVPKEIRFGGKTFKQAYGEEYISLEDGISEGEYKDIQQMLRRAWAKAETPLALEGRMLKYMAKKALSSSFMEPADAEYVGNNFPLRQGVGKASGKPESYFHAPPMWPVKVYQEFTGGMQRRFGKDWLSKAGLYGVRETFNFLATRWVGGVNKSILIKPGQTSLDVATNALNLSAESVAFFGLDMTEEGVMDYYNERDGESIDKIGQNIVLAALGGGLIPPIAVPFRRGYGPIREATGRVASNKVSKIKKEYGEKFLNKNTVEQMAEHSTDVTTSNKLARAAIEVNDGKKGVALEETASSTNPYASKLNGYLKSANEAGETSSTLERKLGASNELSVASSAMDRNVAKDAEHITISVGADQKTGKQNIHFKNTDTDVSYDPTIIKNFTEDEIAALNKEQFVPKSAFKSFIGEFISQDERNFINKGLVGFYSEIQHRRTSDLQQDLKAIRKIYTDGGFKVPYVRARKDLFSYRLAQRNRFDKAVAASRDTEEWLPIAELQDTFKLNNREIDAYFKLRKFSRDVHTRENDNIVAMTKRRGWKVHPEQKASDGTEYIMRRPWKEHGKVVGDKLQGMSDEEITSLPFMKKLIKEYEANPDNQLFIDEIGMGMEETGRILREHPIARARNGEQPMIPWDMGTEAAGRIDGKSIVMGRYEEMVDPTNLLTELGGYSPIVYSPMTYKGGKINHAVLDQISRGEVPTKPAFEIVYGSKDPYSAKKYGRTLDLKDNEEYIILGQDTTSSSMEITTLASQLSKGKEMSPQKIEILMDYIRQSVPDITEKQIANAELAYVPRFIAPVLHKRGKRLAGPGLGREVWFRDETGKLTAKWDKDAAKVVPSLRAWEVKLSQLGSENSTTLVRNQLIEQYEKEFGYMLEQGTNSSVLEKGLLKPSEIGKDSPADYINYRNALGIRSALRQFQATPGVLERAYNRGMRNLAWERGGADMGKSSRMDHLYSWIFSTASNAREMGTFLKTLAGAQVFAFSISSHLNQYAGAHAALWTRVGVPGVTQASMILDAGQVLLSKIPGANKVSLPHINRMSKELKKLGSLGQLTDSIDFANVRDTIVTDVLYGSVITGEAAVRTLSFVSARRQMRAIWKRGEGDSRNWFVGKELTDEGLSAVHRRAQDFYANMTRTNAPRGLTEIPGSLMGQFIFNPALKEFERLTFSKKFTAGEKARMWGASLALYGGYTVPGLIDAQMGIYKLGEQINQYFEDSENTLGPAPTTGRELRGKVHKFLGEYIADWSGVEDKDFWKRFLDGGALNAFLGDGESELEFMNRFGFGMILTDTFDRYSRSAWKSIPALGITTNTVNGIWEGYKAQRDISLEKEGFTEQYDGELGEEPSLEERKDIALKTTISGLPGVRNPLTLMHVWGMNYQNEEKYLNTLGDRELKAVEDMSYGDYMSALTGWGPSETRQLFELREIKMKKINWLRAQAKETYKTFLRNPALAVKRDAEMAALVENGTIDAKLEKNFYGGTLNRLLSKREDSVHLEKYFEKLNMDLEINEEIDVPSDWR